MKLEIDVAALFAKLDPKFKWISVSSDGCVMAYKEKPMSTGIGWAPLSEHWRYVAPLTKPQLFERPVPSAWKRVEDCNLDKTVEVLYKWSDNAFTGITDVNSLRQLAKSMRAGLFDLTWCEIPK